MYQISKYLDKLSISLVFFILSISTLFIYLLEVSQNINHYNNYKKEISTLKIYDNNINNIFLKSYRYIDNDKVNKIIKNYDISIKSLQKNYINETFEIKYLDNIYKLFIKKQNLIEEFKTVNSQLTTSLKYLYNAKNEIVAHNKNKQDEPQKHKILEDILFKIGNIFINPDLNNIHIENDVKKLLKYANSDLEIKMFYQHINKFLEDIKDIDLLIKNNNKLDINKQLDKLIVVLDKIYISKQQNIIILISILSIFTILILLALIKTYISIIKNKNKIHFLAYNDVLTNLPNRTAFEKDIEKLTSNQNKRFIITFIDLDRFKIINDTLGHNIGDKMLKTISSNINKIFGEKNKLYRMGGDEFVGIIKDIDNIDNILNELIEKTTYPIEIDNYSLNSTFSIGIAKYPTDGYDKHSLLKHADNAMYHAKENGGNQFAYYDRELFFKIKRQLDLEQELIKALNKKEFKLFFQPQYSLKDNRIIGVEALIRWNNSLLGNVSPEEFIAVCEDIGIIIDLGYFIFESACKEYMKWKTMGINIETMAINISSLQLYQKDAYSKFKKIIDNTKIDAKNIELELTERHIMDYKDKDLNILDKLKKLGCKISIDDFGTGYSSISYLKYLDVDAIKIDKSFLEDVLINKENAKILKSIIVLSKSLDYSVIAEGIETKEEEALLKSYNCDNGQGYYFAKPMDSNSFIKFYQNHSS